MTSHTQHNCRTCSSAFWGILFGHLRNFFPQTRKRSLSLFHYIRSFTPIKPFCWDVNHCHAEYWISERCLLPSPILLIFWSHYKLFLVFYKTYNCTDLFQEFPSGFSKWHVFTEEKNLFHFFALIDTHLSFASASNWISRMVLKSLCSVSFL